MRAALFLTLAIALLPDTAAAASWFLVLGDNQSASSGGGTTMVVIPQPFPTRAACVAAGNAARAGFPREFVCVGVP